MEKISKMNNPKSLDDLFANFDYQNYWLNWEKTHPSQLKEDYWGKPVGKEILK